MADSSLRTTCSNTKSMVSDQIRWAMIGGVSDWVRSRLQPPSHPWPRRQRPAVAPGQGCDCGVQHRGHDHSVSGFAALHRGTSVKHLLRNAPLTAVVISTNTRLPTRA